MDSKTIACITLAVLAIVLFGMNVQQKAQLRNYQSVIREQNDTIEYHRMQNGKLRADKAAAVVTAKQFEESYAKQAEEIERRLDIKMKNLQNFVAVKMQAVGTGGSTVNNYYPPGDSTKPKRELVFDDSFLKFTSKLDEPGMPSQYTYTDSLTLVGHVVNKNHWFKKEQYEVTATFENPNNKAVGLRNVRIEEFKDKRISFGPYIGIDVRGRASGGFSVQYSLFKL